MGLGNLGNQGNQVEYNAFENADGTYEPTEVKSRTRSSAKENASENKNPNERRSRRSCTDIKQPKISQMFSPKRVREESEEKEPTEPQNKMLKSDQEGQEDVQQEEEAKEPELCTSCKQNINDPDIRFYYGHPQNATDEYIALTDENLILSSDDGDINERPHVNITGFSIYDKEGHLCSLDEGLIESDVRLHLSGYLKSICSDSADIDSESVPVKDIGPIIEWSVHGFDGGENNCITISSEFGEYNLLRPSAEYTHLMSNLYERIRISKCVIEYLEEFHYLLPTYEDLLSVITETAIPELDNKLMTEEMLHKHARFICNQIFSLESDRNDDYDEDDPPLVTLPCIREIIKLFGIKLRKASARHKITYTKKRAQGWTKATTTPLVRKTFETFFSNQLDKSEKNLVLRKKRCGVCDICQRPDCGNCASCRQMAKFGGNGRTKKACISRNCPNMAVEQAEESDGEYEDDSEIMEAMAASNEQAPVHLTCSIEKHVTWHGEGKPERGRTYYMAAKINNLDIKVGDFVMAETTAPSIPHVVTKIISMWKEPLTPKLGYFHGTVFGRASNTVLGEASDPREVFLLDSCITRGSLSSILRLANVEKREIPKNWFLLGGNDFDQSIQEDDGKTYFYQKIYNRILARFEDLPADPICTNPEMEFRFCPSCERRGVKFVSQLPQVIEKVENSSENLKKLNQYEWGGVKWKGIDYRKGNGVFLKTDSIKMKNYQHSESTKTKCEKVDEAIYPEYYRKNDGSLRGSNADTIEPYIVAYISRIFTKKNTMLVAPQDIYLQVNVMYRPENTKKENAYKDDLNLVYWSDEEKEIPFTSVVGLCHLIYTDNIPSEMTLSEWSSQDYDKFYFRELYDKKTHTFKEVPVEAKKIGYCDKVKIKAKGKGKGKSTKIDTETSENFKDDVANTRPLRMLDVFAGCGGLSEGLHQSGAAVSHWAIEQVTKASKAYQLNNSSCIVFNEDCNKLLRSVLDGATHTPAGQRLPVKGDVELLCGGPPCQGFSGMNRFNSREYSNFKNSLVASFLSYCDYYRPKYFILENVRNFVAFKKGMVLKLTLRCLLQIGYQCTFGIVQAGNYGVPQTRRRLIIFAAAPGYSLPEYPIPTHVFSRRACSLSVAIDGRRLISNIAQYHSAPRRTCTIRDAMSDLPKISNGARELEIEYGSGPETDFQRFIRSKNDSAKLRDHVCKSMAPLIQARIARIPTTPGSDWRDLPNIAVTLSDGTKSKVLQYHYHDKKNGHGPGGRLRGVCACASGRPCNPSDKQDNTLIPWCLPHTGNRHNNWAGLYGRISWDGFFSTTVTDPEPMGKQGRILHPEQNRVVSVRECARSQGFPDSYIFVGTTLDKHRQIGNAVPPPLGAALGRELKKALSNSL